MNDIKLSILMPVRNEAENIRPTLRLLQAFVDTNSEILIIYDSPEDNTIRAINEIQPYPRNVRLVHNELGSGVINAIKSGILHSRGEHILITVADDIGPAFIINDMLTLIEKGCDFVSCTRYAYGGRRLNASFVEHVISKIANNLFRLFTGSVFTDATTGIKMFRKSILDDIKLESKPVGWAVVFELAIKAEVAGLKLGEVPLVSIDRLYGGKSSLRLWSWMKEYSRWFVWGVKKMPRSKENKHNAITILSKSKS